MKFSYGLLLVVLLNGCAPRTLRCDGHLTRINAPVRTAPAAPAGSAR